MNDTHAKAAYNGLPAPGDLLPGEQIAYTMLAELYRQAADDRIDRESAAFLKAQLMDYTHKNPLEQASLLRCIAAGVQTAARQGDSHAVALLCGLYEARDTLPIASEFICNHSHLEELYDDFRRK